MKQPALSAGLLKLIVPMLLGISVVFLVGTFLLVGSSYKYWVLVAAYFFPPFGKETIIPIGVYGGEIPLPFSNDIAVITPINPIIMALSIAFVDIIVALFLVWNYDLAKNIPFVGPFMAKVEAIGKKSSNKYSWMIPLRFIGIVLFVMVPFQGSGGLVGSIVGRFIGMKPINTFLAISIGAITGCLLIAFFSNVLFSVFIKDILYGVLLLFILIIFGIMVYMYKKIKKKQNSNNIRQ